MNATIDDETRTWLAKRFDIPAKDIVWFHSGICYDRIQVQSKKSADKITKAVSNKTVNGGCFHDMPLGGQTKKKSEGREGRTVYEIMC